MISDNSVIGIMISSLLHISNYLKLWYINWSQLLSLLIEYLKLLNYFSYKAITIRKEVMCYVYINLISLNICLWHAKARGMIHCFLFLNGYIWQQNSWRNLYLVPWEVKEWNINVNQVKLLFLKLTLIWLFSM